TTTLELLALPQCISFHRRLSSLHLHHHGQLHFLHRYNRPLHCHRAPYTVTPAQSHSMPAQSISTPSPSNSMPSPSH
ncbi:unnamed protein product, partial [Brassica oleracea var. botrytis]